MNTRFSSLLNPKQKPAVPVVNSHAPELAFQSRAGEATPYGGERPIERFPTAQFCAEMYRVHGAPEITPEERTTLRNNQKICAASSREAALLDYTSVFDQKKESRAKLAANKGGISDAEFSKGNMKQAQKSIKRNRREAVDRSCDTLISIAARVEKIARTALPHLERKIAALGINPAESPEVQECARLCWCPTRLAKNNIFSPAGFLKRFGIKL